LKTLPNSLPFLKNVLALCLASAFSGALAHAQVGAVFVIDMENRNWTQPSSVTSPAQIYQNAAGPYINSLVTAGSSNPATPYVSWASAYHNVLAGPTGPIAPPQGWTFSSKDIHPSEPNYLWQEAGINFGRFDDNDPYGSGASVNSIHTYLTNNPSVSGQHLTGLLQAAGIPWATYQEDTDLQNTTGGNGNLGGSLTSTVLPQSQWTVPLASLSGTSTSYVNPYNGSNQYNFACKHDGTLFFADTNGTTSLTVANTSTYPGNPEVPFHKPLQQLATDLANNNVARYNLITPDQFNDMHTALSAGFTYPVTAYNPTSTHYTGDLAELAQGDYFLSIVIPQIMASQAFQNNGVIVIWTDETEGANQDAFTTTLMEIVISKLAKGNAYQVTDNLTHSSDLATLQEIYKVAASTSSGYLNDAVNPSNGPGTQVQDMINFFKPGSFTQDLGNATDTPAMPLMALFALGLSLAAIAGWSTMKRDIASLS
jgi:hypothetical protein